MHVHVIQDGHMRTTVELSDELRARLLELAARRGERGFSALVEEAVSRYLDELERKAEVTEKALSAIGSLGDEDGEALEDSVRALRETWR